MSSQIHFLSSQFTMWNGRSKIDARPYKILLVDGKLENLLKLLWHIDNIIQLNKFYIKYCSIESNEKITKMASQPATQSSSGDRNDGDRDPLGHIKSEPDGLRYTYMMSIQWGRELNCGCRQCGCLVTLQGCEIQFNYQFSGFFNFQEI